MNSEAGGLKLKYPDSEKTVMDKENELTLHWSDLQKKVSSSLIPFKNAEPSVPDFIGFFVIISFCVPILSFYAFEFDIHFDTKMLTFDSGSYSKDELSGFFLFAKISLRITVCFMLQILFNNKYFFD